ncbi:hypothetical protein EWM64_g5466 [Hericium alpestre]|uniref:Uncharacterized protein n=1 Tax=Hericium alpestre TaxID=135208 RepID=A0A4Y9ZWW6_9AGAM|nr:hypothetical protein EWM64_g5466 [Hericium alpestre]
MRVTQPAAVRERFDKLENYFPIYQLPGRHFKPDNGFFCDRATHASRIYCNTNGPSFVENGIRIGATAVVFEVEARISARDCFLSTEGDQEHPLNDDADWRKPSKFASCWLEAPDSSVDGQGNWRRALLQLERLAWHADSGVRTDDFIALKRREPGADPSPAYLQVSWTPGARFDNLDLLPVFEASHKHVPITSRAQMPVNKRVRVRFVLYLGPPVPQLGGPIVGAQFIYMHVRN